MKIVELIRLEETRQGTIGALKIDKEVFCWTLEPPDRLNERNRSSIPAQQYICKPFDSQRHGKTFQIEDVPGRDYVLFHAGNTVSHTEGCVILGQTIGKLRGDRAVLNSGVTFARFMTTMEKEQLFHLTVVERY